MPAGAIRSYNALVNRLKEDGIYESARTFVRGGFWRGFLRKYEEANHLHKKMLYVSHKIAALPAGDSPAPTAEEAQDNLWQGQCNCAYWHGLFGGLYLSNLRHTLYEHLIRADRLADSITEGKSAAVRVHMTDFDADGSERSASLSRPCLASSSNPTSAVRLLNTMTACANSTLSIHSDPARRGLPRQDSRGNALARGRWPRAPRAPEYGRFPPSPGRKKRGSTGFCTPTGIAASFLSTISFTLEPPSPNSPRVLLAKMAILSISPMRSRCRTGGRLVLERHGGLWQEHGMKPFTVRRTLAFDPGKNGFVL